MQLHDKGSIGAYYKKDMLVCFKPGIKEHSNHLLLIDKEILTSWLEENGLCILWILTLEKQILNGLHGVKSFVEWQGNYILDGGKIKEKLEVAMDNNVKK